ncbi:LADA_0H17084g1_1 [Lachancea dasiensis]|uniref:LADA_0H17084g1_1 n=1 Tax=Lachancea dasiensis TaxID=1072105 RepID=A0A1G4K5H0_9SACH|nr:LADA_0H17084g1_1 [Lachancea dasiensis]
MLRDRTNLFLSYRRTFPHPSRYNSNHERNAFSDLEDGAAEESHPMINMGTTSESPPTQFLGLTGVIDDNLKQAESKMLQLTKLYRKNSLPGFEDKAADEQEIEELSYSIIQLYQRCHAAVKSLKQEGSQRHSTGQRVHRGDMVVIDNLAKNYANKIQVSSNKFRMLQNNYLKFLNEDDFKPLPRSSTDADALLVLEEEEANASTQQEIDTYSRQTLLRQTERQTRGEETRFLQQREEEITQLARSVLEVSTIFREMQSLVIDQGTIVDRIDYNLTNTVTELKGAHRELERATVYQKRTQKCKVILLLSLIVVALFFFVMLKPHHHGGTSNNIIESQGPQSNDSEKEIGIEPSDF